MTEAGGNAPGAATNVPAAALRQALLGTPPGHASRVGNRGVLRVTDAALELASLRDGLAGWAVSSNTVRPHHALGYLTPAEWLTERGFLPDPVEQLRADAADPEVMRDAVSRAGDRWHALVCSAGVPPRGEWHERAAWDEIIRVDLGGPFEALRVALPALAAVQGAAVVVGSIVGSAEGSSRSPAYAAARRRRWPASCARWRW